MPEGTTTFNTPPAGVGTSSLSSTPKLGFHLGEPTPEASPVKEPEEPTTPGLKCGRRTSGTQTPGLASPMEKWQKDPVDKKGILNPVSKPNKWLNYMRTEHPVVPHWWEDLVEKKRGLPQEKQIEQAKDLANQIFQTFWLPRAQVHVGGKPSVINTPSSLGMLIHGVEGSIGCRDIRCSYLVDRVKECIIAYGKVLKTLAGTKSGTIPPCMKELIRMIGPYVPVTESEIIKPWPIGGFLLVDH